MSIFAQLIGFCIYYPATDIAHGFIHYIYKYIADDFGPRVLPKDDNKFHGGVNFNCYQGAENAQKWRACVSP